MISISCFSPLKNRIVLITRRPVQTLSEKTFISICNTGGMPIALLFTQLRPPPLHGYPLPPPFPPPPLPLPIPCLTPAFPFLPPLYSFLPTPALPLTLPTPCATPALPSLLAIPTHPPSPPSLPHPPFTSLPRPSPSSPPLPLYDNF